MWLVENGVDVAQVKLAAVVAMCLQLQLRDSDANWVKGGVGG